MRIWFDSDGGEMRTIWKLHTIVDNRLLTEAQTAALRGDIDALIVKYTGSILLPQIAKLPKPKEFKTGDIITAHGDDTYFVQGPPPELVVLIGEGPAGDSGPPPEYGYLWRWQGADRFTAMNADNVKDATPEQAEDWYMQIWGCNEGNAEWNEDCAVAKEFYEKWLANIENAEEIL